jgi:hypothetical protein
LQLFLVRIRLSGTSIKSGRLHAIVSVAFHREPQTATTRTSAEAAGSKNVIPGAFAYHRPKSVQEAVTLLGQLGEDARPLAGGHSLIPMMKLRLAAPTDLVDLAGIADLKGIREEGSAAAPAR